MRILMMVVMTLFFVSSAEAARSCLKRDGDWLHGVTKRECVSIGGRWVDERMGK